MLKLTLADKRHFWSLIDKSGGMDACWFWQAGHNKGGRPIYQNGGKTYYAYRVSYFLKTGIKPGRLLICHECNNLKCCNPRHLYPGTQKKNMEQAAEDGRVRKHEKHPNRKLTWQQVKYIRESDETGRELAKRFHVSEAQVSRIRNRRRWK